MQILASSTCQAASLSFSLASLGLPSLPTSQLSSPPFLLFFSNVLSHKYCCSLANVNRSFLQLATRNGQRFFKPNSHFDSVKFHLKCFLNKLRLHRYFTSSEERFNLLICYTQLAHGTVAKISSPKAVILPCQYTNHSGKEGLCDNLNFSWSLPRLL